MPPEKITEEEQSALNEETLKSDLVKSAIETAVSEAVTKATEGLETNRDTILAEKRELSNQLKLSEEAAKKFEGLDIAKIRTMIDAVNQSDEAKLISEGKIDEVIAARTSSVKAGYEAQFVDKDVEIQTLTDNNTKLQNMYESKLIGDAIQAEAIKQGMLPEAIKDAVRSSGGIFTLGDDGAVQASKADEFINSPERFIKSLKESNPYYWPSNADFRMSGSGGVDSKDLNTRIEAAAAAGDFDTYKELRSKQAG